MANPRIQRRLRFLMRALIACWVLCYGLMKTDTFLLQLYYQWVASPPFMGMSRMVFVWLAALALFIPVAAVHWLLTRSRPEPDNEAWRDVS